MKIALVVMLGGCIIAKRSLDPPPNDVTTVALLSATPAMAGVAPVPAPVMGAGIGALALMGVGYFAIRRRGR